MSLPAVRTVCTAGYSDVNIEVCETCDSLPPT
jgi:hypothetical protein